MPDEIFKKLPKFGNLNFGTAKVHYCPHLLLLLMLNVAAVVESGKLSSRFKKFLIHDSMKTNTVHI